VCSILQARLLRIAAVRSLLGMWPLSAAAPAVPAPVRRDAATVAAAARARGQHVPLFVQPPRRAGGRARPRVARAQARAGGGR
jgi:hypothetical protein